MEKERLNLGKNKLKVISTICIILCVLIWIPNIVFQIPSPFFLLNFIISSVGIVLAVLVKSYWLIAINILMFFSFFIFMGIGYYIDSKGI